ncbi:Hypothetical predicted protein [Podarcis lilfordi]|uniref:Uncharacterized protein n=1 Tax=Podarcis lilfordi TaxID=74358 RepID=A0AA35K2I6_9SAUR|nr:Hypothetical predicted protein [Podarcis lilfordi]
MSSKRAAGASLSTSYSIWVYLSPAARPSRSSFLDPAFHRREQRVGEKRPENSARRRRQHPLPPRLPTSTRPRSKAMEAVGKGRRKEGGKGRGRHGYKIAALTHASLGAVSSSPLAAEGNQESLRLHGSEAEAAAAAARDFFPLNRSWKKPPRQGRRLGSLRAAAERAPAARSPSSGFALLSHGWKAAGTLPVERPPHGAPSRPGKVLRSLRLCSPRSVSPGKPLAPCLVLRRPQATQQQRQRAQVACGLSGSLPVASQPAFFSAAGGDASSRQPQAAAAGTAGLCCRCPYCFHSLPPTCPRALRWVPAPDHATARKRRFPRHPPMFSCLKRKKAQGPSPASLPLPLSSARPSGECSPLPSFRVYKTT